MANPACRPAELTSSGMSCAANTQSSSIATSFDSSSEFNSIEESTVSYESTDDIFSLPQRDIRTFRLRYLCVQSCNQFYQHQKRRIPSGKAVYLSLLICLFERIAFYGGLSNILSPFLSGTSLTPAEQAFVQAIAQNIIAQVLYPIAGGLADVWIGRYRAIHVSLWIMWVGYASIAFSFSFLDDTVALYFLPIGFIITSVGTAGFQANNIPFGADQILYRTSEELSSYFYWYYWVRNVGAIMLILSYTCSNLSNELHVSIFAVIATASITIALSLNAIFNNWFTIDPERRNPMKTVAEVLYNAGTAKRPRERSAFGIGREPPPRIDLAKLRHGGRFTNEQVEDVKTFLRLLFVLLAMGGSFVVYTGITSVIGLQIYHMEESFLKLNGSLSGACFLSDDLSWGFNVATIIIVIPILELVIFPYLRQYTPSMLKKIGLGNFLALLSPLILLLFEGLGPHSKLGCMFAEGKGLEMNAWLTLIPHTAINIAEIFLVASALEFFYAQSPHNMRGMMIGLFFFVKGMFSVLAAVVLFIFSKKETEPHLNAAPHVDCGFWYYLILFIVGLISFTVYLLVSRWYKNRQRGELEENEVFYLHVQIPHPRKKH